MSKYTIHPDTPGNPTGTDFKVFHNHVKVATLSEQQVFEAVERHTGTQVQDMARRIAELENQVRELEKV